MQLSLPDSAKVTDFPFATEFVILASMLDQFEPQINLEAKMGYGQH